MALYFASRGQGQLTGTQEAYISLARILLSGLGADELFGGYSRHRRAFNVAPLGTSEADRWLALEQEMDMDLQRIGLLSSTAREAQ